MASGYAVTQRPFTIANGATASGEIEMAGLVPVGIIFPAAFTGATVSFKNAAVSGGTPLPLNREDGTLITVTVATSTQVKLNPLDFAGCTFLTVVSASTEGQNDSCILLARDM
jgi:hypothetical protein